MRAVLSLLLSVAVLVCARAQSPVDLVTPSGPPPGTGQEITIDDLRGIIINITVMYSGRIRWSVDNIVRTHRLHQKIRAQIGPGGSIRWTVRLDSWADGKPFVYSPDVRSGIIGRSDTGPTSTGARAAVWTFDRNTLTLLRVFERGGRILRIAFDRIGSGLNCTATGSFLQELGAGNPKFRDPSGKGGYHELIGMKQTSSTCRVSKN